MVLALQRFQGALRGDRIGLLRIVGLQYALFRKCREKNKVAISRKIGTLEKHAGGTSAS